MSRRGWAVVALAGLALGGLVAVFVLRPALVRQAVGRLERLLAEAPASPADEAEHPSVASFQAAGATAPRPALRVAEDAATAGASRVARRPLPLVHLHSPEMARRAGLALARPQHRRDCPRLFGNAEIAYNANRFAEVRPRVSGLVREVMVDEGSEVKAGEPMMVIDSAEVGAAKAVFLAALPAEELARQTLEMTLKLRATNSAPLREELNARAASNKSRADVMNARQHLMNLGYSPAELERIEADQDTSNLHRVVAPIDGTVVVRHAVTGEAIDFNHPLFSVADTRIMWVWIDVYEDEVDQVAIGQPVELTIPGAVTPSFHGRVDWIDAGVNQATRTIRVRAEIENPSGRLRNFEFGRAAIETGPETDRLLVPRESVQEIDQDQYVFVPRGPDVFEALPVLARPSSVAGMIEIVSGLGAEREVASSGSFILKSELVRARHSGDSGF